MTPQDVPPSVVGAVLENLTHLNDPERHMDHRADHVCPGTKAGWVRQIIAAFANSKTHQDTKWRNELSERGDVVSVVALSYIEALEMRINQLHEKLDAHTRHG